MGDDLGAVPLSEAQLERYARHLALAEIGFEGQRKLLAARVLVVGAGGLGSPAALYLAAAGVGTIGIADGDRVERSNLQRQILHANHDLGRPKTASARERLEALNPDVRVVEHRLRLGGEPGAGAAAVRPSEPGPHGTGILELIRLYDVVVNGSDNFPTRYLLNDACVALSKPLVDASVLGFSGQVTVFLPGRGCYRCLFPEPPAEGSAPSCAQAGVVGALTGILGSLQALEVIKIVLGVGGALAGRLLLVDGLAGTFRVVGWERRPDCAACGHAVGGAAASR